MNVYISETGEYDGTTNINFFRNVRKRTRRNFRYGKYMGRKFRNENNYVGHDAVPISFSSGQKNHNNLPEYQNTILFRTRN